MVREKRRQRFRGRTRCLSQELTYAFLILANTRAGVNGASRMRAPTASKIALAIAAAIGALEGSPPPRAGISGRLIKPIPMVGTPGNLTTGYLFQLRLRVP